jgi:hypothetical protein
MDTKRGRSRQIETEFVIYKCGCPSYADAQLPSCSLAGRHSAASISNVCAIGTPLTMLPSPNLMAVGDESSAEALAGRYRACR